MKTLIILLVLILIQLNLLAQTDGTYLRSTVENLHEKCYLACPALGHVEPTIFEGNLAPHKYFDTKKGRFGIDGTCKIVFRMLDKYSCPIYTPSYMPMLSFHSILGRSAKNNSILLGTVTIGHHSNGQSNNFYNEDGSVNIVNGNFATDYFKVSVTKEFFSKRTLTANYLTATWEQHLSIEDCKELIGHYGFTRLHLNVQTGEMSVARFIHCMKKTRIQLNMNAAWICDRLDGVSYTNCSKRFIGSTTLTIKPGFIKGLSGFIQTYVGQDYYNINFNNHLSFARFGINIEPFSHSK